MRTTILVRSEHECEECYKKLLEISWYLMKHEGDPPNITVFVYCPSSALTEMVDQGYREYLTRFKIPKLPTLTVNIFSEETERN